MKNVKKFSAVAALAVIMLAGSAAPAFAQSASSTPGSHRKPYVAGLVDSINNKGAWLLTNPWGTITYISANPVTPEEKTAKALWIQTIKKLFYIDVQ